MPDSVDFKKLLASAKPEIERLIHKISERPDTFITGFVFRQNPTTFIKFGNIENRGDDIIKLYVGLASLAARVDEGTDFEDINFEEITGEDNKPVGDAPEEIADALAKQVLITALEPAHAADAVALAQRYLASRRPLNGNNK